jgi:hypothetical protein
MKALQTLTVVAAVGLVAIMLFKQGQAAKAARQEIQVLRLRLADVEASNEELARRLADGANRPAIAPEHLHELEKLRADVLGCGKSEMGSPSRNPSARLSLPLTHHRTIKPGWTRFSRAIREAREKQSGL